MLRKVRIRFSRLSVEFDRDYGVDAKTGWSIAMDGAYVVQLIRCPGTAVFKAVWVYWFVWDREARQHHKEHREDG